MVAAEIVTGVDTPHPCGKVGGAVARIHEIAEDRVEGAGMRVRSHDRTLSARPIEHMFSNWVPLAVIRVQQTFGRSVLDGCCELPAQVQGIAKAEIKPLTAQRGVDVRGVAG